MSDRNDLSFLAGFRRLRGLEYVENLGFDALAGLRIGPLTGDEAGAGDFSHFISCNGAPHDPQASSCPWRAVGFSTVRALQ